ncbi:hypothetical protein CRE_19450 [Caenorhabditis remanei]|uniref:Uncharacterized protein n=1 Tax=Caenorhabditis remanei TaxID=31234 RepID=E3NA18_CAERE|nr:hypothetical protein CRE_19450 [Caenorhabditis remanei]
MFYPNLSCFGDGNRSCHYDYDTEYSFVLYSVFVGYLANIVIFPIYVYVNRTNEKRDKKISLYPFTNHFYKVIRNFNILSIISFISILVALEIHPPQSPGTTLEAFVWFGGAIAYFLFLFIVTISFHFHHFMLFILSLQRCLFHFYPNSKTFLKLDNLYKRQFVIFLYILTGILVLLKCVDPHDVNLPTITFLLFTTLQNTLLLVSALLQIVVAFRIRKQGSSKPTKLQKFVFWQTVSIAICVNLSLIPFLYIVVDDGLEINDLRGYYIAIDGVITLLLIQLTYLVCNRKSLVTICKKLKPRQCCKSSRVQPISRINVVS